MKLTCGNSGQHPSSIKVSRMICCPGHARVQENHGADRQPAVGKHAPCPTRLACLPTAIELVLNY